jgi:hypothetical protein
LLQQYNPVKKTPFSRPEKHPGADLILMLNRSKASAFPSDKVRGSGLSAR